MDFKKLNKNQIKRFLYNVFIGKTITRKIFMFYIYAITIGIILLSLPISLRSSGKALLSDGQVRNYRFIDSFFTSISAFTDTGLTTINIVGTYSIFGQIVIMFLIQLGGLGLFTLYWLLWNLIFNNFLFKKFRNLDKKNIGFSNTLLISSERGDTKLGLSIKTIKTALIFILICELLFATIYSLMFYFIPSYEQVDLATLTNKLASATWYADGTETTHFYNNIGLSIFAGIFQSISTMNNAGFDIISQASYSTFRNGVWTVFLYISIIQIIIGGIGYPVIYDLTQYFKYIRHRKQVLRFSLFTKVSTITYFIIALVGIAFIFGFEYGINNPDGLITSFNNNQDVLKDYFGKDEKLILWNQITSLIFNVFSSRSAGMSTFSQSTLSYGSLWIINILMFIGCAPSSTGGGIRTTTLAVLVITIFSHMKGYKTTNVFKKTIPQDVIVNASIILVTSILMVALLSFITYPLVLEIDSTTYLTITDVFFEFSSSFGTVGLSTGLCNLLNGSNVSTYIISILLCMIMIVGQLGVSTTIFAFRSKNTNKAINYANEEIRL